MKQQARVESKSASASEAPHQPTLTLTLTPIPKLLKRLVDHWSPRGSFIVSFKLETDPRILREKSEKALRRYGHHVVIGNLLERRGWEVLFLVGGGVSASDEGGGVGGGSASEGSVGVVDGDGENSQITARWIRVPPRRRLKSSGGMVMPVLAGTKGNAKPKAEPKTDAQDEDTEKSPGTEHANADDDDDDDDGDANEDANAPMEIESLIVPEVVALHARFTEMHDGRQE